LPLEGALSPEKSLDILLDPYWFWNCLLTLCKPSSGHFFGCSNSSYPEVWFLWPVGNLVNLSNIFCVFSSLIFPYFSHSPHTECIIADLVSHVTSVLIIFGGFPSQSPQLSIQCLPCLSRLC
jgi:hypothetical protein